MLGASGTLEGREWPPVDLLDYSQQLRQLIAADKARYVEFHKLLAIRYPEPWVAVGFALKTRARYYRGEIFRAKRDLQRYMMGEDPKRPSRYGDMLCDWVTEYIYALPEIIESMEDHWDRLAGAEGEAANTLGSLYEADSQRLELQKADILKVAKELEGKIYGG